MQLKQINEEVLVVYYCDRYESITGVEITKNPDNLPSELKDGDIIGDKFVFNQTKEDMEKLKQLITPEIGEIEESITQAIDNIDIAFIKVYFNK